MTPAQVWMTVGAVSVVALGGLAFLWLRMPVFQWYCRRCKKIVSAGRFHPGKCACGAHALMAYFCRSCASWNTSPKSYWHCVNCSSKAISIGAEYHFVSALWTWHNRAA
jgi:hypothetical protein